MAAYNKKLKGRGYKLALKLGSGDIPAVKDFTLSSDYKPGVLVSLCCFKAYIDKALRVKSKAIIYKIENNK